MKRRSFLAAPLALVVKPEKVVPLVAYRAPQYPAKVWLETIDSGLLVPLDLKPTGLGLVGRKGPMPEALDTPRDLDAFLNDHQGPPGHA